MVEPKPDTYAGPVIDSSVRHCWADPGEVLEYMSAARRAFLGPNPFVPPGIYDRPGGNHLAAALPASGPAGSSRELLAADVLDADHVERALLVHDAALLTPALPDQHLATDAIRAINDWTIERWLGGDERLHASILVHTQLIGEAVAEIERRAEVPGVAGVSICANGLGKPFGHPVYQPIYEAAVAADLTVILHAGGDAVVDTPTPPTGGGLPSLYTEAHVLAGQWLSAQLASLVAQGVFERFPRLRLLVTGGGVGWVPWILWRLDVSHAAFRWEVPWLKRRPSDYVLRNVWFTAQPLNVPHEPSLIGRWIAAFPGLEDRICYASGYPSWDRVTPDELRAAVPGGWHERVLHTNAAACFGWRATDGKVNGSW